MKNVDYTLYLVTDRDVLRERDLIKCIEESILGGVTLVQLREKNVTSREFYEIAIKVKEVTSRYNIPLIINDRLDIALAIDADGLHIGQKDLPASVARKILGKDKILGVSAATLQESLKAEKDGADYLGVGAVFSTSTKKDTRDVSYETLSSITSSVNIPVVAIGGINEKNVTKLKESNIDGIAVISCILGKEDVKGAAEKMLDRFKEGISF
ncbi:thiamine phosphate synthase [Clostridium paraputrificum]|uniref:thiamine phosphate synthase n=1 Tax=Clostridium paraputrificum TaxID=29363 RepID=UPI000C088F3F|nr:thiamine phosphate synthase [Clostridium paraputrificum]